MQNVTPSGWASIADWMVMPGRMWTPLHRRGGGLDCVGPAGSTRCRPPAAARSPGSGRGEAASAREAATPKMSFISSPDDRVMRTDPTRRSDVLRRVRVAAAARPNDDIRWMVTCIAVEPRVEDRLAEPHRLEHADASVVAERGHDEDVAAFVEEAQALVRDPGEEADAVLQPQLSRRPSVAFTQGSIADDPQAELETLWSQKEGGLEQGIEILPRVEPTDEEEDRPHGRVGEVDGSRQEHLSGGRDKEGRLEHPVGRRPQGSHDLVRCSGGAGQETIDERSEPSTKHLSEPAQWVAGVSCVLLEDPHSRAGPLRGQHGPEETQVVFKRQDDLRARASQDRDGSRGDVEQALPQTPKHEHPGGDGDRGHRASREFQRIENGSGVRWIGDAEVPLRVSDMGDRHPDGLTIAAGVAFGHPTEDSVQSPVGRCADVTEGSPGGSVTTTGQ